RRAARRRPAQAARRPRPARTDGGRGPPHRARELRVAAGSREARGLLRRPSRRRATGIGKREVITRFVVLGAVWIAATAVIGQAIGSVASDVIKRVAV